MPYILKNELHLILNDLPEHHVIGRSGSPAAPPKAARAAICTAPVNLDHKKGEVTPSEIRKIRSTYRKWPDTFWHNKVESLDTQERFDEKEQAVQQPSGFRNHQWWEIGSGSGARWGNTTHTMAVAHLDTRQRRGVPVSIC